MNKPVCVDLDGTLVKTDTLIEAIISLIRTNFLYIFLIPFWLLKGLLYLKQKVVSKSNLDIELLPFNQQVIQLINDYKSKGHEVILITASPQLIAEKINNYLKMFDDAIGSDLNINYKKENKMRYLESRFGKGNYIYIGNCKDDIPVWDSADTAIIVSCNRSLQEKVRKINPNILLIKEEKHYIKLILKQFRIHQWTKNLLLFLPILMAHQLFDYNKFLLLISGFIALSLSASAIYVINDLFDLNNDRLHPTKRNRPLAAGEFPILLALIVPPILILVSLIFSYFFLPLDFLLLLIAYILITFAYSSYLKRVIILDILILASLYTIRIISGGYLADVYLSPWLLTFSMFIFLSLAIVKRYTELRNLKLNNDNKSKGRGYITKDIDLMRSLGTASAYISIMVFALYINSKDVIALYTKPSLLWAVALLLLYWITRIWFLAERGEIDEDPLVFTVKDKVSYFVGLVIVLIVVGASI